MAAKTHTKPAIGIVSLGCPRNLVDSESILSRLKRKGYRIAEIEKAGIALLNTCAFVEDAKTESIDAILDLLELKKQGKLKKVIVYGCLVQRYAGTLRKEFPEVDAFVGSPSLNHEPSRFALTPASHAYLKISEGCVNRCSFCSVPGIKSRLESLDEHSALAKIDCFDREGITEIDIIGQDITGYGLDSGKSSRLPALLRLILGHSRQRRRWFRLLYLHPSRVSNELLSIVAGDPRMCPYIDLPIQHISDRVLKLMNRHTSRKQLEKLIALIRRRIPQAAIRTTLIVGFPGETEKEFEELVSFVQETGFERLGAFVYSREEDTAAFSLPGQVPEKVKHERFKRIMAVQQEVSARHNRRLLGKTVAVLIDEKEKGHYLGRTRHDAPEVDGTVFVRSRRALEIGEIVPVHITDTMEYDLSGEVTDEHR